MPQYLFDTDHLTLFDHSDVAVWRHFSIQPLGSVSLSAVSVEETLRGRLAGVARHQNGPLQVQAYANLIASLSLFQQFTIVPFDSACEGRYQQLRGMRLRIGNQDLRIAAVALANNLVLLTRNRRDFGRVPALMLDDWSL
ncbi:MAG TPA: type II toxin-antitoxin system VapC family toxin [Gemmataceae bacterium]|jgi:tRNA(fMet)-specific endonuclease VapC